MYRYRSGLFLVLLTLVFARCTIDRSIAKLSAGEISTLQAFEKTAQKSKVPIAPANEPGEPLMLCLTFVDQATQQPLAHQEVYFYQANTKGQYKPSDPADESTAYLHGTGTTDQDGRLFVTTILPGDYGTTDDNRHIHMEVVAAKPSAYDIHFKQYATPMLRRFVEGSDQHFLADLKQLSKDSLIAFVTVAVKRPKLPTTQTISRQTYRDQLYGFWLGACIANWTGLVTEMDKIGNIGDIKTGNFYTRNDWGQSDQPSIWGEGIPSDLSPTIDFVTRGPEEIWGADDDTDIEYMYQHLMYTHATTRLTPEQIRTGWLKHIKAEEENYLWVSNQQAFDLMQKGVLPPKTGVPENNPHFEMIDAQLTTELFGLFAPGRPDIALKISHLPIRTTAYDNAAWISEFYVVMHALASSVDPAQPRHQQLLWIAGKARQQLPDTSYSAKMYDFVLSKFEEGLPWETTRDSIYQRYQVEQQDGYQITSRNLYCNGCFAAGINFAASLVSLFYGKGDFKETIKIAALAGWDADNPAATWGGLLGFMIGKKRLEEAFNQSFSNQFHIHRTRQHFPNDGIDTFDAMAEKGISIIDRMVTIEMGGSVDTRANTWEIPFSVHQ